MLAWYEPWKSDHSQNGVITLPHKPIADDIFRQLYPFKVLAMDMLKDGQLPLWNPYNGSGQPLFATMHIGILNPFNLLFFVTDNPTAWSIQVILSLPLVGIATFLFARKVSLPSGAALIAAVSFMLSGFVISRSIYADYNYAVLCLPLLLFLIEDYIQSKTSRMFLCIPLVVAYMFTVTQPQIIVYILLITYVYAIFRIHQTIHLFVSKQLVHVSILFFLGVGLASIQLFPTIELFQQANITNTSSQFIIDRFLLPPLHFISLVIPNYFGNQATYNYWGSGDYVESITSLGAIPCFLALFACLTHKKKRGVVLFFFFTALICILLTIDTIITRFIYALPIPILSTGVPSRLLFLPVFCLSILAGFGIQQWQQQKKLPTRLLMISIAMVIAIVLIPAITIVIPKLATPCPNPVITECWSIALRNSLLEVGVFVLFGVLFFSVFFLQSPIIKKLSIPFTLFLILLLGTYNAWKFIPFTKKSNIMPEHALLHTIKNQNGLNKFFGFDSYTIKTDFATHYKIYEPNYYDPLYIKRYGELIQFSNQGSLTDSLPRSDVEILQDTTLPIEQQKRRETLFSLLGVQLRIHASSTAAIFTLETNKNVSPKAFITRNVTIETDPKKSLKKLFEQPVNTKQAVLNEKVTIHHSNNQKHDKYSVTVTSYKENRVVLQTMQRNDGILVLHDNYYPGWVAFVDGKQTPIIRANHTFRAIELPRGNHEVLFSYEPFSLRLGLYSTLFFAFLYLCLFIFWPKVRGQ